MNALNRLVMIIIALLLVAVPLLLLLVGFGLISSTLANTYTGYQGAASAIGGFSLSGLSNTAAIIAGVASALVALLALILILRELTPGPRRGVKQLFLNQEAGKETRITSKAVRSLAAGAARQAGALSPNVSLSSQKKVYKVGCKITAPETSNYTELAERVRHAIQQALDDQGVPVKEVEVTVDGIAPVSEA